MALPDIIQRILALEAAKLKYDQLCVDFNLEKLRTDQRIQRIEDGVSLVDLSTREFLSFFGDEIEIEPGQGGSGGSGGQGSSGSSGQSGQSGSDGSSYFGTGYIPPSGYITTGNARVSPIVIDDDQSEPPSDSAVVLKVEEIEI